MVEVGSAAGGRDIILMTCFRFHEARWFFGDSYVGCVLCGSPFHNKEKGYVFAESVVLEDTLKLS